MDSLREGLQPCRPGRSDRGFRSQRLALTLALLVAIPVAAQEPSLVHRTLSDVKGLATAPAHWKKAQWKRFGEGLALVGVTMLADQPILDAIQRNRSGRTDRFLNNVTHLGGGYGQDVTIALILGGLVTRNREVRDTGIDALESSVWAAGVVTPIAKQAFGRSRPFQEHGTYDFEPFSSAESFPSGHSTNAWAIATAIASHSDGRVIPTIAYTLATTVSLARLNSNVHFPSDVVAGALIGRAVAKSITARHQRLQRVMIMPNRHGIVVALSFRAPQRARNLGGGTMKPPAALSFRAP